MLSAVQYLFRFWFAFLVMGLAMSAGPARAQIRAAVPGLSLRGTALDAATGEPLVGATVRVLGTGFGTTVGLDGSFVLRGLPAGATTVQCQSVGYSPQQQSLTLTAGPAPALAFRLAASTRELDEVTVTGRGDRESDQSARRSEQKADNVLNIIAARAIELSPDVTVGNVVQRASGVSVVRNSGGDGQYAIIRGMDRRYNYTLVNGIKIPSPDPNNRYVPLDIFPAELLERLEVIKALTPSMEGDAIGGALNLVMKSAPDHLVVAATAAGGYSDLFANRAFVGFSSAGLAVHSPGESHGQLEPVSAGDFSNKQLGYSRVAVPVNSLFGLTLGNRTADGKLGLLVAGSLQTTHRGSDRLFYRQTTQPKPEPQPNTFGFDELRRLEYSLRQQRLGLHAKLDYQLSEHHRLSLYSLLTRLDDAQQRHTTTNDLGVAGDIPSSDFSRFRRQLLWSEALQGEHQLSPRLRLGWSAVYGRATYDVPDQTTIGTVRSTAANVQQGTFVTSNSHTWQRSLDQDVAGYANLGYAATDWLELSVGGLLRHKNRDNFYDYYDLGALTTGTGTSNRQVYTTNEQALFTFNSPGDALPKKTDANNYAATERIIAGYVQAKLQTGNWQLVGGLRREDTRQVWTSQAPPTTVGKDGVKNYPDWLPSAHLKYRLSEHENLRASYFQSISRPNLIELIPATYYDPERDIIIAGNPLLRHTTAHSADLRYEYFGPAAAQLLAGVFYKRLTDPIEFGFAQVGNNGSYYQPQNPAAPATNFGAELQFVKYLRHWGLTGNYTYTHSRITTTKRVYYRGADGTIKTADATQATTEFPTAPTQTRPLQGQSDHIANLALLYKDEATGFNAQVAAVYTGRRVNTVSPYRDLDEWQRATTQLDFSAEQRLPAHLTAFLKITNLLNTPTIAEVMQAPPAGFLSLPEQSRPDRILVQRDTYSRTYLLGLRYRLN